MPGSSARMSIWPCGCLRGSGATPVDECSIVVHNAEGAPDAGFFRANVDLARWLFAE